MKIFATEKNGTLGKGMVICLDTYILIPAKPEEMGFNDSSEAKKALIKELKKAVKHNYSKMKSLEKMNTKNSVKVDSLAKTANAVKYTFHLDQVMKASQSLSSVSAYHVFLTLSLKQAIEESI